MAIARRRNARQSVKSKPNIKKTHPANKATFEKGDKPAPSFCLPPRATRLHKRGTRGAASSKTDTVCMPKVLINKGGSDSRNICILYSGGTLGMLDLGNGKAGPIKGALAKRLELLEELDDKKMPKCWLIEIDPLCNSADFGPKDWSYLASVIFDFYYEYDGFVIIHGTDTLAYTSSALSFMLENLAKPVVVTGSLLPICASRSDARQNLLGAIVFAGLADISEVCVFFAGELMRGNRSNKTNATMLDAFTAPAYPPLAEMGTEIDIYRNRLREPPRGRFRMQTIEVTDIIVLWVIPGFSVNIFDPLIASKTLKGVVLLLYGAGNAPGQGGVFLKGVEKLVANGVVVVACSQCLQGTVSLHAYAAGKVLEDRGVISAGDMTTEATVTKLSYLLSKGLTVKEVRECMVEDLRGELSTENTTFRINEPSDKLVKTM